MAPVSHARPPTDRATHAIQNLATFPAMIACVAGLQLSVAAFGNSPAIGPQPPGPENETWVMPGPEPDGGLAGERPEWSIAYDQARLAREAASNSPAPEVLPMSVQDPLPPNVLTPPDPLSVTDLESTPKNPPTDPPSSLAPDQAGDAAQEPLSDQGDETATGDASDDAEIDEPEASLNPLKWITPWIEGWDGKIQLGFNGSAGNSESSSGRIDLNARRTVDQHEVTLNATYRLATRNGVRTENRFRASGQYDWKPKSETKWRLYATGRFEVDEFQAWDYRVDGFVGGGYDFIKNDETTFITRLGFGGRQDFGGPDTNFRPEGVLELEASQKLSDRQTINGRIEIVPNFESSEYRVNSRANWSIVIDPESNLSLRVGADIRYDSGSRSNENTDIDYFMTLGWSF